MRLSSCLGLVASLFAVAPAFAMQCPVPQQLGTPAAIQTVEKVLPPGIDLDAPNALESAIYALAQAGFPDDLILDNLIAAYCASIATEPGVADITKTQRVQDFAARITPVVYSDED